MSHELVFLAGNAEVAGAITRAAALADRDPSRARTALAWTDAGGEDRRILLFPSTRCLAECRAWRAGHGS